MGDRVPDRWFSNTDCYVPKCGPHPWYSIVSGVQQAICKWHVIFTVICRCHVANQCNVTVMFYCHKISATKKINSVQACHNYCCNLGYGDDAVHVSSHSSLNYTSKHMMDTQHPREHKLIHSFIHTYIHSVTYLHTTRLIFSVCGKAGSVNGRCCW